MVRAAARTVGAIVSIVWLVPLLGGLFGDGAATEHDSAIWQGVTLTVLVLAAIACTVMASIRGGRWSVGILTAGVALCFFAVVTAGRNHWIAVLVAGVPWVVVGALFVLADRREPADGCS